MRARAARAPAPRADAAPFATRGAAPRSAPRGTRPPRRSRPGSTGSSSRKTRFVTPPVDVITTTMTLVGWSVSTSMCRIDAVSSDGAETSARRRVASESISVVVRSACSISSRIERRSTPSASGRPSSVSTSSSAYRRYPLSVGVRPADVCGCVSRPRVSSSASSPRTVDAEKSRPERSTSAREPTGWPDATYSSMTSRRISRFRGVSCISVRW